MNIVVGRTDYDNSDCFIFDHVNNVVVHVFIIGVSVDGYTVDDVVVDAVCSDVVEIDRVG